MLRQYDKQHASYTRTSARCDIRVAHATGVHPQTRNAKKQTIETRGVFRDLWHFKTRYQLTAITDLCMDMEQVCISGSQDNMQVTVYFKNQLSFDRNNKLTLLIYCLINDAESSLD
jgi:hypothetical protein